MNDIQKELERTKDTKCVQCKNPEDFYHCVPCVQCGYCCTVAPCSYGEMAEPCSYGQYNNHTICIFLTKDNKCAIYNKIVEKEKDSKYPMMGSGCSSALFNERRDAKLKELNDQR